MITLTIIENIFSPPEEHEVIRTENVLETLYQRFGGNWPECARLYSGTVAHANDVTPGCEEDIKRLAARRKGAFVCVLYPKMGVDWAIYAIIAAVVILAAVAVALIMKPSVPSTSLRNTNQSSPNNELSQRTNEARPNGRVPDIFGTVRSYPDLLVVPYTEFELNTQIEYTLMCIGRGEYRIERFLDGETRIDQVPDSSVEVYGPGVNVNGGEPHYVEGPRIVEPVKMCVRSNAVNGQTLEPPNSDSFVGNENIIFETPNSFYLNDTESTALVELFSSGQEIVLSRAFLNIFEEFSVTGLDAVTWGIRAPSGKSGTSVGFVFNYTAQLWAKMQDATWIKTTNVSNRVQRREGGGGDADYYWYTETFNVDAQAYPAYAKVENNKIYVCAGWYVMGMSGGNYKVIEGPDVPSGWAAGSDYGAEIVRNNLTPSPTTIQAATAHVYDLSGTYTIHSISNQRIFLQNPAAINPDWNILATLEGGKTVPLSPTITSTGIYWQGPFIMETKERDEVWINLIAVNGLYKDNGSRQYAVTVDSVAEITPLDKNDNPTGPAETFSMSLYGSSVNRETVATTFKCATTFTGKCSTRVRRITATDKGFKGSVIDEVQWRDLYAMANLPSASFPGVTTVKTRTKATAGALSLKERKLNAVVTRLLPRRISGSDFTSGLYPTNDVADIFSFICLDPKIGNRTKSEIDFDNIYDTIAEVKEYFGTHLAAEFCYTMDSIGLSFEDTAAMVANASFCTPYRTGNVIRFFFEKETDLSAMLFNHRNKIPGSETRTFTFGYKDDQDGVRLDYVTPEDDSVVPIHIPDDKRAINPKKVDTVGIRNKVQAHFHASRVWNKQRYQCLFTEYDATQEADLLTLGERIRVTNNLGHKAIDGEVRAMSGLEVFCAKDLGLDAGKEYTCFLQLPDKTIQGIAATAGNAPNSFILTEPPMLPLVTEDSMYAKTTFELVEGGDADDVGAAFMVMEKKPKGDSTTTLTAANYDARYYQNDKDFINGIISEEAA